MKLVKKDKRGRIYEDEFIRLILSKKGTIRGEHIHQKQETFYLISGKIDLIIEDKRLKLNAPSRILIPGDVFYTIKSTTKSIVIERLK